MARCDRRRIVGCLFETRTVELAHFSSTLLRAGMMLLSSYTTECSLPSVETSFQTWPECFVLVLPRPCCLEVWAADCRLSHARHPLFHLLSAVVSTSMGKTIPHPQHSSTRPADCGVEWWLWRNGWKGVSTVSCKGILDVDGPSTMCIRFAPGDLSRSTPGLAPNIRGVIKVIGFGPASCPC